MYRSFLFLLFGILCGNSFGQSLQVPAIYCDEKENPLGTGAVPAFSWQLASAERGVMQASWHVIVDDNLVSIQHHEGSTWNSGVHPSDQSIQVLYTGRALQPAKKYYWRVEVTDDKGNTAWSNIGSFTTALFTTKDWSNAAWIGYEQMPDSLVTAPGVHSPDIKKKLGPDKLKQRTIVPLFRKTFAVNKKIAAATVFVTGVGQYEMSINGKKVGKSFLSPGWTYYDSRVLYNTYDVTRLLQQGDNALGMIVGNGFYNINRERYIKLAIAFGYPAMICKLLVNYTDGSSQVIVSDKSWKTTASPITFASIYGGEDYNALLEQQGWDQPAFDDATWKQAIAVTPPKGALAPEQDYPVTIQDVLNVKTVSKPKDSVYVYDFGQNMSGIVEITVQGKKGQVVKLTPSELLNDRQLANQNNTGKPYYLSYTLKGDGVETWRPRFTYYGFRYVQVEGAAPDTAAANAGFAKLVSLHALHTRNSSPSNGSFSCSNELFNRINTLIQWAIRSNLQSVETDCPHREKLSWLEQDYLMGGSVNANFNVHLLYTKLVHDMMDAQTKEGMVPDIAPEFTFFDDNGFGFRDSPEWGSASVVIPWLVYKWYGDDRLLAEAYPMMQRYVAYLQSRSNDHILDYGLGDWYDYGPNPPGVAQLTPKALTATAIWYYDIQLLHNIATLLHKKADALQYEALGTQVQKAFNTKFFDENTKTYATGSQTAMAMPLVIGLVDSQYRAEVMRNLEGAITTSGNKLTAGDIGFHFLVQALQDGDASQLLYDMNNRDDVAGYGYQLKKGATALTESWAALKEVSNNHLMLGHIMQWFYEGLGGIRQSDSSVAYKDIIIRPEPAGDLNWVTTDYYSPYGNIGIHWAKQNDLITLDVRIPVNTHATIYLPARITSTIREGETTVSIAEGSARLLGYTSDRRAIIRVGSGSYHFTVK